jgi:hypothetical protein
MFSRNIDSQLAFTLWLIRMGVNTLIRFYPKAGDTLRQILILLDQCSPKS